MENGFKKFFKKLIRWKYPNFLDVYVTPYVEGSLRYDNPLNKKRYEIILVIHEKDYREEQNSEIYGYVKELAKHMDVEVMDVYYRVVDDEEWGELNK